MLPFGIELEEKGVVVACRPGCRVGTGIADRPTCELSFASACPRRLNAELLLRTCLPKSYTLNPLPEKKLVLEAVIGVLGVLFVALFGGGVRLPWLGPADGAEKEEMRLLTGVSRGSRFRGGSLIGCKSFLLECCIVGVRSKSALAPTVSPRLCLIDPVLELSCVESLFTRSVPRAAYVCWFVGAGWFEFVGAGWFDMDDGVLGFTPAVENENV